MTCPAEKDSDHPPPGFPGLETALPLLLNAVHEGRLTMADLVPRMSSTPRRIFGLQVQAETWLEVDPETRCEITADTMQSRAGWTPFEGFVGRGRLRKVILRGQPVFEDGRVLAAPGSGRPIIS